MLIRPEAKAHGIYEWNDTYTTHGNRDIREEIYLAYDSVRTMLDELMNLKKVDIGEDLSQCLLNMILLVR